VFSCEAPTVYFLPGVPKHIKEASTNVVLDVLWLPCDKLIPPCRDGWEIPTLGLVGVAIPRSNQVPDGGVEGAGLKVFIRTKSG
jgi:hypothetical protein